MYFQIQAALKGEAKAAQDMAKAVLGEKRKLDAMNKGGVKKEENEAEEEDDNEEEGNGGSQGGQLADEQLMNEYTNGSIDM